ncbi:D-alanyl-D-alanine carboxypeptidase, partial [Francisella tularensis subsp. holarctica]|uniref:D-alanyl-D-alanine carboxypeptidase n=1 Tax=Francisella tularensis TaxID=263 RepID=UPI002381C4C4
LVKKYNLSDAKMAIATQTTNNGDQLYAYAQNRLMTPARTNKVFTIVAALFTIPSNFRFTTSIIYPSNRVKYHTLYGDMYIKFT